MVQHVCIMYDSLAYSNKVARLIFLHAICNFSFLILHMLKIIIFTQLCLLCPLKFEYDEQNKSVRKKLRVNVPQKRILWRFIQLNTGGKNLAPTCMNTDNCLENATRSRVFRKKDKRRFTSTNKQKCLEDSEITLIY